MIIITGTSRGIGKSLAALYLRQGKRVLGISRTCSLKHPNYTHVVLDLSDNNAATHLVFPDLSKEEEVIFIHNAGTIGEIKRFSDQTSVDLQDVLQVNLFSGAQLLHQLLKSVDLPQKLSVVFISSGAGKRPIPSWAAYCASKAAVDLWLQTISQEEQEKGRNIRCLAISPGVVDTDMQRTIRATNANDFSSHERFSELHANNELRSPDLVAQAIAKKISETDTSEIVVAI